MREQQRRRGKKDGNRKTLDSETTRKQDKERT